VKAEDILGLLTPVTYFMFLGAEAIWPARAFPAIRRWRLVGLGFLAAIMTIGILTPMLLPVEFLARHRLIDGTKLGVVGGTIVGLVALEFVGYWIHRAAHRFSFMWRFLHQMHHSVERIDVASSAVFHPFEVVYQTILGVLLGTFVLGLDPVAAAVLGYLGAFFGTFQHLNMRTPRWLGYVVQRPESHSIHHELNVHAFNYGNITLWDIVFGTFRNPERFEGRVGFASRPRYADMLVGRDVSGGLGDGVDKHAMEPAMTVEVAS
jgi:sterol desaturase/sphingolipid hydroxylase (fatty acid hydroxylase superfamily)